MGLGHVLEIPFPVAEEQLALRSHVGDHDVRVAVTVHVTDFHTLADHVAREVFHCEVAFSVIEEDPVYLVSLCNLIPFRPSRGHEVEVPVLVEVGRLQGGVMVLRVHQCLTPPDHVKIRYAIPVAVRTLEVDPQISVLTVLNRTPWRGDQEIFLPVLVHVREPDPSGPVPVGRNIVSRHFKNRALIEIPVQHPPCLPIGIPHDDVCTADEGVLRGSRSNQGA